ncbi:MAG: response regulator transcription factor, partial [Actinomycetales bacterium]
MVRRLTERLRIIRSKKSGLLPEPLTKRELEILRHLATNETVKDIGSILNVSMNTMKTHVKNIYKKLKVDSRIKAIEKAKELFLI